MKDPLGWIIGQPHLIVKRGACVVATLAGIALIGYRAGRILLGPR